MKILKILILTLLMARSTAGLCEDIHWKALSPGLEYLEILPYDATTMSYIHAFRIDPKYFKLEVTLASDLGNTVATVREFAQKDNVVISINGGFFTPKNVPLGLRVKNGEIRYQMHETPWWGVFYIDRLQPYIVSQNQYTHSETIDFAIQAGPRLIIGETIPNLKPGKAERTALGITSSKRIIIVVTEHYPIDTTDLALIMRDQLKCQYALNLDGGNSSQLYANIGTFKKSVPSLSAVTDAVIVIARKGGNS